VPGDCQQRRGSTWVVPDSSDKENGTLANVATRNVLGCFSISIYRFTLAFSSCKRHLHELRKQPPLLLGGASIDNKNALYSRSLKNLARQQLHHSDKSAFTGSQRPICQSGATGRVRGF